jgi:hypothetical protein
MRSAIFLLLALAWVSKAWSAQPTSCVQCHGDIEWMVNESAVQLVKDFEVDVHKAVGISCHDCHGGNPDPALAEEMFDAMDENHEPNPYLGTPSRQNIPEFCGRCHSEPTYMRHFRPDARVDQVSQYWTSQHGRSLKMGDTKVATCVDCHPAHTTRRPSDPQSKVYPTRVAETCSACHSDPERMAGYTLPNGQPVPTDQHARWLRSGHARALLIKEDLSAPTCNSCHGDHGATPPNIASTHLVCGQCHGREAGLFRDSTKLRGFSEHNDYLLPGMGETGCAECHDAPHPSSSITRLHEFTECGSCHGHHSVVSPRITMLGPIPPTPCAYCHEGRAGREFQEPARQKRRYEEMRDLLLANGREAGLSGDALFDWLVDQALELPQHEASKEVKAGPSFEPEFRRLFDKFRIAKTHFTYTNTATGNIVREAILRCVDCHSEASAGFATSRTMHDQMHELAVLTARANRILLAARRGGVEVRQHHSLIDNAINAQIELQVLVHGFAAGENAEFETVRQTGLENAQQAITAGYAALDELSFRRKGLFVSLGIVLLVLLGLGLKIREISRREEESPY